MKSITISDALAAMKKVQAEFSSDPDITSVSVGYKVKDGKETRQLCVRVGVKSKRPLKKVPKGSQIPKSILNKRGQPRIPTDVIETGVIKWSASEGGSRCTHKDAAWPGTLGFCVEDGNGDRYLISNNHVLARCNWGRRGDQIFTTEGNVAALDDFVPISFVDSNSVDAAIAKAHDPNDLDLSINAIGSPSGMFVPKLNEKIAKTGATTGYTEGRVTAFVGYLSFSSELPDGTTRTITFENVYEGSYGESSGDSGSAIINEYNEIVGLHFAGQYWGTESVSAYFVGIGGIVDSFALGGLSLGSKGEVGGILVFEDTDYRGRSGVMSRSDNDIHQSEFKDEVSSIRHLSGSAIVYEHVNYGGRSLYIEDDVYDTAMFGFGDNISSLHVYDAPLDGITLYSDKKYRGRSTFIHRNNDNIHSLHMRDNVSSVKKHGIGYTLLYEHADYGGRALLVRGDINDTHRQGFGNNISSARVFQGPLVGVEVFEHTNYKGKSTFLKKNDFRLGRIGMNDNISSINPIGGATAIVYKDANYGGKFANIKSSIRDTNTIGMHNNINSIKVLT